MYYVYLLKSLIDNKSYVGYTSKEVKIRIKEHNIGSNKWTKNHKPFKLIYYETFNCSQDARSRKIFFKSGIGRKLKKLILDHFGV